VADLRNCALGERIFFADHGRPTTNLAELQADGILTFTPRYVALMSYRCEGTNWSISVAKAPQFAGYYCATATGLFFHPNRAATSGDLNLDTVTPFRAQR
jgi:hypothetical protein